MVPRKINFLIIASFLHKLLPDHLRTYPHRQKISKAFNVTEES